MCLQGKNLVNARVLPNEFGTSQASKPASTEPPAHNKHSDAEFSIEDVDEDRIDEILRDATKNLVVFFCTICTTMAYGTLYGL